MTEVTEEEYIAMKLDLAAIRDRLDKLEAAPPSAKFSPTSMLNEMPTGELIEINPKDQAKFLRSAQRLGIVITTAKTKRGGMVMIKTRKQQARSCPHCGRKFHR